MRRAISRTCGRCSRMSLSRSVSLSASGVAHELYVWAIKRLLLSGRAGRRAVSPGQDQLHQTRRAGDFQVFRDALAGSQKRHRLTGAGGLVDNGSERVRLVGLGEEQALRAEDLKGVDHPGEVRRLHRAWQDQLRVDILPG